MRVGILERRHFVGVLHLKPSLFGRERLILRLDIFRDILSRQSAGTRHSVIASHGFSYNADGLLLCNVHSYEILSTSLKK